MRAVAALLVIQDSDKNPQLNEFVLHIRSSPDLQVLNSGKHNIFFLISDHIGFFTGLVRFYSKG
jgi:hypothetical protein